MAINKKQSSDKLSTLASEVLKQSSATKAAKSLAGSVLSQSSKGKDKK